MDYNNNTSHMAPACPGGTNKHLHRRVYATPNNPNRQDKHPLPQLLALQLFMAPGADLMNAESLATATHPPNKPNHAKHPQASYPLMHPCQLLQLGHVEATTNPND